MSEVPCLMSVGASVVCGQCGKRVKLAHYWPGGEERWCMVCEEKRIQKELERESSMQVDINKRYQTRSGKPVELISTNGRGDYPIIGYIGNGKFPNAWQANGQNCVLNESTDDLVEVPQKHVRWVNVYRSSKRAIYFCMSEEQPKDHSPDCIACVRVEFEEGEGLQQEDRHE